MTTCVPKNSLKLIRNTWVLPRNWAKINQAAVETALPRTEQCLQVQLDSIAINLNIDKNIYFFSDYPVVLIWKCQLYEWSFQMLPRLPLEFRILLGSPVHYNSQKTFCIFSNSKNCKVFGVWMIKLILTSHLNNQLMKNFWAW